MQYTASSNQYYKIMISVYLQLSAFFDLQLILNIRLITYNYNLDLYSMSSHQYFTSNLINLITMKLDQQMVFFMIKQLYEFRNNNITLLV